MLLETQQELEAQRKIAEQVLAMREENVHMRAREELIEEERQRLKQEINDLHEQIVQLATKAGQEFSKGFLQALRETNVAPPQK